MKLLLVLPPCNSHNEDEETDDDGVEDMDWEPTPDHVATTTSFHDDDNDVVVDDDDDGVEDMDWEPTPVIIVYANDNLAVDGTTPRSFDESEPEPMDWEPTPQSEFESEPEPMYWEPTPQSESELTRRGRQITLVPSFKKVRPGRSLVLDLPTIEEESERRVHFLEHVVSQVHHLVPHSDLEDSCLMDVPDCEETDDWPLPENTDLDSVDEGPTPTTTGIIDSTTSIQTTGTCPTIGSEVVDGSAKKRPTLRPTLRRSKRLALIRASKLDQDASSVPLGSIYVNGRRRSARHLTVVKTVDCQRHAGTRRK